MAFLVFYALLNQSSNSNVKVLQDQASIVIREIASEQAPLNIITNNQIDQNKLNELILMNQDYETLKRNLKVEGDFCIYFEDENGKIMIIANNVKGIGSPNILLLGTPCNG